MYKEVILFLTGKLAEKQLTKILENLSIPSPCKKPTEWNYRVKQLGLSVAALMTGDLILRRLKDLKEINNNKKKKKGNNKKNATILAAFNID